MQTGRRWFTVLGVIAAVLAIAFVGRFSGADNNILAQDAASPAAQEVQANQPVTIHSGVCGQTVPEPEHELNHLVPYGQNEDGTFDEVVGSVPGLPVLFQSDSIDGTFEDFNSEPYAIAIHESPETFGTIIACADIGGPQSDGRMVLAIRSIGGSGFAGIAVIDSDEGGVLGLGEDQLNVTTYVIPQVNAEPQAQPAGQTTPVAVTPED